MVFAFHIGKHLSRFFWSGLMGWVTRVAHKVFQHNFLLLVIYYRML